MHITKMKSKKIAFIKMTICCTYKDIPNPLLAQNVSFTAYLGIHISYLPIMNALGWWNKQ